MGKLLVFIMMLALGASVQADPITIRPKDKVDELTTKSGIVYKDVTIREIKKSGVRIMLPSGFKTIPAEELPQYKFLFDRIEGASTDNNEDTNNQTLRPSRKSEKTIKWPKLILSTGKIFKNATVLHIQPDGISIMHDKGGAKIPYEELPVDIQQAVGGFDENEAKAFRAKNREILRKQVENASKLDALRRQRSAKIEQKDDELEAKVQLRTSNTLRVWTDTKTGQTLEAKLVAKSEEGKHVKLEKADSKTVIIKTDTLSKEDQDYIASRRVPVLKRRPGNLKMTAKSVSWGTKKSSWSYIWGNIDSSGAQILSYKERNKDSRRVLGIDLRCRGSRGGDYVVEVFWFGFPLANKRKRYVCAAGVDIVTVPPDENISFGVASNYNYKRSSLLYLESDPSFTEWRGLYVRTWSGYTYAGWAVRVSDGFGKVLAIQGAQPSFLRHVKNIPLPRVK